MKPFFPENNPEHQTYIPLARRDVEAAIRELQRIANEHTADTYLLLHREDFEKWEADMRGFWGASES